VIRFAIEPTELPVGRSSELVVQLLNDGAHACLQLAFRLSLPESFVLVGGKESMEVDRLEPGETARIPLEVRPRKEGEWNLMVRGISFWDGIGRLHRIEELKQLIAVTAAPQETPALPPSLEVKLLTEELPLSEWGHLRGLVRHLDGEALTRLAVRVTGRVHGDPERPWRELSAPDLGGEVPFAAEVRAPEAGEAVPVSVEARFVDRRGRDGAVTARFTLRVNPSPHRDSEGAEHRPRTNDDVVSILVLLANPVDTHPLRLGAEARELQEELRRSKERDRFALTIQPAARAIDVSRAILDTRPKIVHFSGHGSRSALYLETDAGAVQPVSTAALSELASLMADSVDCVILNACFSESQAREIVRHIPHVIGMRREIEDESARKFTIGFYMALGAGEPVERAFRYGCQLIGMEGRSGGDVPALLSRGAEASPEPLSPSAAEVK
jgi:hypothetical protein